MIYLNNAATTYPKPEAVKEAFAKRLDLPPSGQYRSAGLEDDADVFDICRKRIGSLLKISETDRIFFSSGSTEGLNSIIAGLGIPADKIITTVTEHNSVLRPLYNLPGIKGKPLLLRCDENGTVSPGDLEAAAGHGMKAFILNHCSNVTGAVQDAEAFGRIAKKHGILFILDVSQSAGCVEVDVDGWNADAVAFTGHKSLMGPQGTGGYYVRKGIGLKPLKYGGTGYDSSRVVYDGDDYEYEVGTMNSVGIAALSEAVDWVSSLRTDEIKRREMALSKQLIYALSEFKGIHVIGSGLKDRGPVVSFFSDTLPPSDLAYILQNSYGIVTRAGLHCAPLIHDYIGSGKKGTLRVSFSGFNTQEDVDAVIAALRDILG